MLGAATIADLPDAGMAEGIAKLMHSCLSVFPGIDFDLDHETSLSIQRSPGFVDYPFLQSKSRTLNGRFSVRAASPVRPGV